LITRSDLHLNPRYFRGRHHAATIFVVLLLAVFGFRLFPERDVTVLNDGQAFRVSATFNPQSEGLAAASVSLSPGDRVLLGTGGNHTSIAVQRARPVAIEVDGKSFELRTRASTVAGALAEAGIDLHPADQVYLDDRLTTGRGPLVAAEVSVRPVGGSAAPSANLSDAIQIRVERARPVTVFVDTLRVETASAAPTVDGLLSELGMTVREGDLVRPSLDTPVSAGLVVRLAKARTVSVKLDGKDQSLYTLAGTVADILPLLGVDPAEVDLLEPSADTLVQNGMSITIGRTRTVEEEVKDPVAPATVYETDPSLQAGAVRIIPGVDGERVTQYRLTYRNGLPIDGSKVILSSTITRQPVPTRHIEGAKPSSSPKPVLNAPGYTGAYTRKLNLRATWYNASHGGRAPGDPAYGLTATGVMVDYGICAVDRDVIPLGTRLYVEGYGPCLAADTGGAVKGNTIDLGFPESAGNSPWSTQWTDVYVLD
jgi:uncharacterized protein YabE (DUF348 family)